MLPAKIDPPLQSDLGQKGNRVPAPDLAGWEDAPIDLAFEVNEYLRQYRRDIQVKLTGIRFDIIRRAPFKRLVGPELGAANSYSTADSVAFHPPFRTSD